MKSLKTISAALALIALFAMASQARAAWTVPAGVPPAGNVMAPVNTGATAQIKSGPFSVTNIFVANQGIFGTAPGAACGSNILSVLFCAGINGKGIAIDSTGNVAITGNLAIQSGGPGVGKVLTSDATGNATWQPGSATLPTLTGGGFDIKIIKNWGQTGGYAQANCNAGTSSNDPSAVPPGDSIPASGGYKLIGGGGACDDDTAHIQESRVDTDPQVNNNGWKVSCQKDLAGSASGTRVQAICMKYTAPILAVSTPTPTPATPLTQTSGVGSFGDSCIQTFGNHTYTARVHDTTGGSAVDTDLQNQCFYMKHSNPGLVTNCYPLPATGPTSNAILYQAVSSCGYSAGLGTYSGTTLFQ